MKELSSFNQAKLFIWYWAALIFLITKKTLQMKEKRSKCLLQIDFEKCYLKYVEIF